MADNDAPPTQFFELINRIQNTPTSLFDILGISDDERDHTKVLAWLLTPDAGHGLGTKFLNGFLEQAGVETINRQSDITVQPFWQELDGVELDLRIQTELALIGVEIKTTHSLSGDQYERQSKARQTATEDNEYPPDFDYIHLTYDGSNEPPDVPHRLSWSEIIQLVQFYLPDVADDSDIIRLREWCRCLQENVIDEFAFHEQTQLALRYPNWVEEFGIEVDQTKVAVDRKQLFNGYQRWFTKTYRTLGADNPGGWDGRITSEFRQGTKIIRIYKPHWYTDETKIRFEVLAKDTRMREGDTYSSDHDLYRTPDSHIELTLTYPSVGESERDALADMLTENDRKRLHEAGFIRVRDVLEDMLPEESDSTINPYHIYSFQVPLDFDNPQNTVDDLKRGTEALVGIEETITNYMETLS